MMFIKLSLMILSIALFLTACNTSQTDETTDTNPYSTDLTREITSNANDYHARENLDLQAVGTLLERADNAEELEHLLNSDNRINNLDLNQDGYADYIGVTEFEDRNDGERGLSLFSKFGPDVIQEIATIIFDRGGLNASGARVLLTGNEQLYGDNNYYEANWLDRALPIVKSLFNDRDSNYSSPYYNGNYPDYYQTYQVVETPVYRTRVEQIYSEPVFIQTTNPTINEIEISSPYDGRTSEGKNYPKPDKLTKKQAEFRKNNFGPPEFVSERKGWTDELAPIPNKERKEGRNDFERPRKAKNEKFEMREKPYKVKKDNAKPPKEQGVEIPSFNLPRPNNIESPKMKPPKPDKSERGKGVGNKPGHGNGGGKDNGGGKGKGGGKKN